jgi:glycosyltransferase involved in cell wall biosynthesis
VYRQDINGMRSDTPPQATPRVSVVICTRDRPDKIGNAVSSVVSNSYADFDLTVVDQSTAPTTGEVVRSVQADDPRVRYIHMEGSGLSRAYNCGIRETDGEIIAFTDDDCIVPADWITSIVRAFDQDAEAELLYGQVVAFTREGDEAGKTPLLTITAPGRLSRRDGFKVFGMGANFAARRQLFATVGEFDEILGGGGPLRSSQDFDLAYRAYRSGSVVLLRPEVTLHHDGFRRDADWPALLRNYGIGDGGFYSKHVRCGDLYALALFARRFLRTGASALLKSARGWNPEEWHYLGGVIAGVRQGFRFKVDRDTRRYCPSAAPGGPVN